MVDGRRSMSGEAPSTPPALHVERSGRTDAQSSQIPANPIQLARVVLRRAFNNSTDAINGVQYGYCGT